MIKRDGPELGLQDPLGAEEILESLEASGTGTFRFDILSRRILLSERAAALLGIPQQSRCPSTHRRAARGAGMRDTLSALLPQDRRPLLQALRQTLRTGQAFSAEVRPARPAGGVEWVLLRGGPNNVGGRPYVVGLARDFTEKKAALTALEQSESRFRALVEATAAIVWTAAPDGTLKSLSPVFSRFTGLAEPLALGDGWLAAVHPDDRAEAYTTWRGAIERGQPHEVRYRVRQLNGEYRWFLIHGVPVFGHDGLIREWVGTATDIHGQQQAEALLRKAHADLKEEAEKQNSAASEARRLNRVYATLSGITGLILRTQEQSALFDGVCRIAVRNGSFRLAWIGIVVAGHVRPVAVDGHDAGYLDAAIPMHLDHPGSRGPTARALLTGEISVCNDIETDPGFAKWRDAALARGFLSSIAIPLFAHKRISGCLCLYAAEKHFFDKQEIGLLGEVAANLGYAMEHIATAERLEFLASHDALTGLPTRRKFEADLRKLLEQRAEHRSGLFVMTFDLVNFKGLNDQYGSGVGDRVLCRFSHRLKRYVGREGRLARLSGDRFAIAILVAAPRTAKAESYIERIWGGLNRPLKLQGDWVRISCRSGVAAFPSDGSDAAELIRNAEEALKKAKSSSSTMLFFKPEMSAASRQRLDLEARLGRALEEGRLQVFYQPRVGLKSGRIVGAEALLRWSDPVLGSISPSRFIPLLEESGRIIEVGRWLLTRLAADRRSWSASGLGAPRLSVNVSPVQLRQHGFSQDVIEALDTFDGLADCLELEITESVLLPDLDEHLWHLHALRERGVRIAIDDFGTGYSSLSRLHSLPISTLKIDRSFVVKMTQTEKAMNIVSTIIALAKSMQLEVVAEGVDEPQQIDLLRSLHCDEVQGFLISPAVSAADFARLLDGFRCGL